MALENGVSVTINGKLFNRGKVKLAAVPEESVVDRLRSRNIQVDGEELPPEKLALPEPVKVVVPPAPPSQPVVVTAAAPIVNVDLNAVSASNAALAAAIQDMIKQLSPGKQAAAPVKWKFTVVRDSNRLLQTITAEQI